MRTIPEIINYCPCKNSLVPENPPYDWNFACRHVFRASTVQNGGEIPADKVPLLRAWGGEWLGNMHSLNLADERDLKNRLSTNCFEASVFNAKHARSRKSYPRKFPISVVLSDGAAVHPELSWVHVDRRRGGKVKREAKINLHHVVFTARMTEVEVAFDNERTNPGDEIGINCVSLTPYYGDACNAVE